MRERLVRTAVIAGATLLLLAGEAWAQGNPPPGRGRSQPGVLVAPGKPPQLIILHSGGVVGYVDPCG